jgi:ABC-type multidrug transport system fused ATPase/permease subunit
MQIAKNTTVGFVGTTGCGKTTLVDVIMGLLEPSSGSILVDGSEITSDQIQPWQRNFGYVPQGIFLSDASVAANIALGVPEYEIDAEALEEAAKAANLHEFVENELPHGYNTVVGERGIRLSGGQKQRIGIARALYHDPAILVMDEATSALDSVTEEAVMDAIQNLIYRKTILLIAHRLTTVQDCDVIYLLDKGRIRSRGTYEELLQMEPRFRAMAKSNVAT